METHHCRRGEEEKEEGVRNCEEMSLFIGREGKKKGVKVINAVKKTCKNTFFDFTTVQKHLKNVLFMV